MTTHDELLLRTAVKALQADAPDAAQLAAAARRVAGRLDMGAPAVTAVDGIDAFGGVAEIGDCGDVQHLLAPYRAGSLSDARRLFIADHLRDCGVCLRQYRSGSEAAVLDWSAPVATPAFVWRTPAFAWQPVSQW